jgi:hypothetical protein
MEITLKLGKKVVVRGEVPKPRIAEESGSY